MSKATNYQIIHAFCPSSFRELKCRGHMLLHCPGKPNAIMNFAHFNKVGAHPCHQAKNLAISAYLIHVWDQQNNVLHKTYYLSHLVTKCRSVCPMPRSLGWVNVYIIHSVEHMIPTRATSNWLWDKGILHSGNAT
jgi:hypothetical protein